MFFPVQKLLLVACQLYMAGSQLLEMKLSFHSERERTIRNILRTGQNVGFSVLLDTSCSLWAAPLSVLMSACETGLIGLAEAGSLSLHWKSAVVFSPGGRQGPPMVHIRLIIPSVLRTPTAPVPVRQRQCYTVVASQETNRLFLYVTCLDPQLLRTRFLCKIPLDC